MDFSLPSTDAWDFSGTAGSSITGAADYPPVPAGATASDALGIFQSIGTTILDAAKTVQQFQTAYTTNQANMTIAKTNAQTQTTLAQIQAQTALAKAQAALTQPNSGLFLILAIVGLGIAWMQYAK